MALQVLERAQHVWSTAKAGRHCTALQSVCATWVPTNVTYYGTVVNLSGPGPLLNYVYEHNTLESARCLHAWYLFWNNMAAICQHQDSFNWSPRAIYPPP